MPDARSPGTPSPFEQIRRLSVDFLPTYIT